MGDTSDDYQLPPEDPGHAEPTAEWTLLVFIHDRDVPPRNREGLLRAFSGHGSDAIRVLVQWAPSAVEVEEAFQFRLPHQFEFSGAVPPQGSRRVANPGQCGGGPVVAEFLRYASVMFPARRYGLIFFGSQGQEPFGLRVLIPLLISLQNLRLLSKLGWLSSVVGRLRRSLLVQTLAPAEVNGTTQLDDRLTIGSLASHLNTLKRAAGPTPSLIVFDACCMATVEVLYELRHVTEWVVAAPYPIGAPKSDEVQTCVQNWKSQLAAPTRTIAQLAARDLSTASAHHPMLAVSTDQSDELARVLGGFVDALLDLRDREFVHLVTMAREKRVGLIHHVQTYDLVTFVSALNDDPQTPPTLRTACDQLLSDLNRRLGAIHVSTDDECVYGGKNMTIYFPGPTRSVQQDYSTLSLVSQSNPDAIKWPKFLERCHSLLTSLEQRDCTNRIWQD